MWEEFKTLDSSDDDVFIIKENCSRKQKANLTTTHSKPEVKLLPRSKKCRITKKIKQKFEANNLNQDIEKLLQRQKRKRNTEIILSDDSEDFDKQCSFRKPIIGPLYNKSIKILKRDKNETYIESWIKAAVLVQQDKIQDGADSITCENNKEISGSLDIPCVSISNAESKTQQLINGQEVSEILFRSESPDLFDCGSYVETNINNTNTFTNTEYVECAVDINDFLKSENESKLDVAVVNGSETFRSNFHLEPTADLQCKNSEKPWESSWLSENIHNDDDRDVISEKGSENGELSLKSEFDNVGIPVNNKEIVVESIPKPIVFDGIKKQSTITSFFGGKNSKPVLSFAEVNTKETGNKNAVKNNKQTGGEEYDEAKFYKGPKNCPFYKKISGSKFCVDAFSYGSIPGIEYYFLSHFHYDHYMGLNKHFKHTIYCTKITADLITIKLGVAKSRLQTLSLNQITTVDGVDVTPIEANHCPGAVMFIFYFPSSGRRILHTGDFRFHKNMMSPTLYRPLQDKIHQIYLDTTYLDSSYNFPPQEETITFIKDVVTKEVKADSQVLVVCGSYTIGKEKVFMAAAEVLDCSIWAQKEKQRVLSCLEPEIKVRLVQSPSMARVHILPMQRLTQAHLRDHLKSLGARFRRIVAFKPTGWTHTSGTSVEHIRPSGQGDIQIYGVPYSEHSSFGELEQFIKFLKPEKVIPTVNIGNESSRSKMNSYIQAWLRNR